MTYYTDTRYDLAVRDHGRSSRKAVPQNIIGGVALACVAVACVRILYVNVAGPSVEPALTEIMPPAAHIAQSYAALLDSGYSLGTPAENFKGVLQKSDRLPIATRLPLPAAPQVALADPSPVAALPPQAVTPPPPVAVALNIPLPTPRPSELRVPQVQTPGPSRQEIAQATKATAVATAEPEKPGIFERLFGKPKLFGAALAYAAPDGGVTDNGESITPGRYDRYTAVYDISARVVYMPDGTKLEAHSGLGNMLDDPRHVRERMRGPTPPHLYDLTLRESLFHGVQALRLNPVGGDESIYGRSGLLAHTYMLGPNGDSNGCVSFRNYNTFLEAYKSHQIKRLAVVARLD